MKKKAAKCMTVLCAAGLLSGAWMIPAQAEEGFSYEEVSDRIFYFSSGVGAWGTELLIHEDGSFEGSYHDSDMGSTGEGYPNGTVYVCDFSGQFSEPGKVNEYTYSAKILELEQERENGTSEIVNNVRYVYSDPYGLNDAENVLFYLPGAPLEELPEAFLRWVGYFDLSAAEETELPFAGLYNEAMEQGFSSYENQEPSSEEAGAAIDRELSELAAQAAELENQINSGALSQSELNQLSAELYLLWDDELNSMWGRIREILPEDEMAQLTEEELEWINEKEEAIAQAGAEFEGGSMQPFGENSTAARLTRERVYELAEYLR
ncbi:MAG: lysozyme inhibitor LprI family protein [Lachnospiraceae bacterium]|nr:lysozyme inhibitor LprI family protein [Lachnospiraceae bacterium]